MKLPHIVSTFPCCQLQYWPHSKFASLRMFYLFLWYASTLFLVFLSFIVLLAPVSIGSCSYFLYLAVGRVWSRTFHTESPWSDELPSFPLHLTAQFSHPSFSLAGSSVLTLSCHFTFDMRLSTMARRWHASHLFSVHQWVRKISCHQWAAMAHRWQYKYDVTGTIFVKSGTTCKKWYKFLEKWYKFLEKWYKILEKWYKFC